MYQIKGSYIFHGHALYPRIGVTTLSLVYRDQVTLLRRAPKVRGKGRERERKKEREREREGGVRPTQKRGGGLLLPRQER
jgi:hypothetical protein